MFDLATAKTRLNLAGTAQDDMLTAALNAALAIAENYCDRRFFYKHETVAFYDAETNALILSRYPIDTVISIGAKASASPLPGDGYHVHKWNGMIYFHGEPFYDEIQIEYTGGYQILPADLELALWLIFDATWGTISGQAAAVGGGAVKAIRSNGASIEYDTSSSSAGTGGFASAGSGGLPIGAMNILETYRRTTC